MALGVAVELLVVARQPICPSYCRTKICSRSGCCRLTLNIAECLSVRHHKNRAGRVRAGGRGGLSDQARSPQPAQGLVGKSRRGRDRDPTFSAPQVIVIIYAARRFERNPPQMRPGYNLQGGDQPDDQHICATAFGTYTHLGDREF